MILNVVKLFIYFLFKIDGWLRDFGFAVCLYGGEERGVESGDVYGEVFCEFGSFEGGGVFMYYVKVY